MNRSKLKKKLKKKSRLARKRADALLKGELNALKRATKADFDAMRPKITAKATYDKLLAEVRAATRRNESIAKLKNRIQKLGRVGVRLAKRVAGLLSKP